MARVTAAALRDLARSAMLACGGRGFMRFADGGGGLLVTDALRRCGDDTAKERLAGALHEAGFACREEDGLLYLTPQDVLLSALMPDEDLAVDWESPLHGVQALSVRWQKKEKRPLTDAGRRLIIEALRLTWQPRERVLAGCAQLRAMAAVMLREHDLSGLHEAGAVLGDWCQRQEEKA